jgi:hypothetical protein
VAAADAAHRSDLARYTALGTLAVGTFKSYVLDHGRLVVAGINQSRQGDLHWMDLAKDVFRGPSTASVPVTGGWWGRVNKLSNGIGASLSAISIGAALVNAQDAIADQGPGGMVTTRSGRFATFTLLHEAFTLGLAGFAGVARRDAGQGFLQAFTGSSWLASPAVKNVAWVAGTALGLSMFANELGWFDFLNAAPSATTTPS